MRRSKPKYNRVQAEKRFGHVYLPVEGDRCIYCGIANDGKFDHQPPVYVLHRFANGGLVTKRAIRERFGDCKLVPCCTICNMGLGAYNGKDNNDRRREIVNWFLEDDRYPEDKLILDMGVRLLEERFNEKCGLEIYEFPGVGRIIYIEALMGFVEQKFKNPNDFPDWLQIAQEELAEWLRGAPKRKSQHFLDMASLESYQLLPHAWKNPRGPLD